MPRETVVKSTLTPEQQAKDFAGRLESVAQAIGWLQTEDKDAVATAYAQCHVEHVNASLPDLRRVAVVVKRWGIEGAIGMATAMAAQNGTGAAAVRSSEVVSAAAAPGEPLTELEQLRERIKKLETAEEERQTRQKKMQACLKRIDKAEDALRQSAADLEAAKGEHKAAEAEVAHALNELKLTAKGLPIQMELPLPEHRPTESRQDAWRMVELSTLGLSAAVVKKLADHEPPLATLGTLSDWQAKKGDFWAKDIKGIGEAAAEQISKACEKYWAEHPPAEPSKTALATMDAPSGPEATAVSDAAASPPHPLTDTEMKEEQLAGV